MLEEASPRASRLIRKRLTTIRSKASRGSATFEACIHNAALVGMNGLSIERRYDAKFPVKADRAELHQLVTNLIVNALEAIPESQGAIKVHIFGSRDWQHSDRTGIRIVVADSGIGMDRETRRRIAEPFFTTKHQKGTGLGLSVVQWIAAKYDGSLHVHSCTRPGRSGTCVSVFLSAVRAAEPAKPGQAVYHRSQAS